MINRFKALEKREQQSLVIGLVAILLFMLYQFVFQPFNQRITRLQKEINYQRSLHDWMDKAKSKLNNQITLHHIRSNNLLSETTRSLKNARLDTFSYDLQQADNDSVRLAFDQVPYLSFIKWMETYWSQNALFLHSAVIKPTKIPGTVKVAMTFSSK